MMAERMRKMKEFVTIEDVMRARENLQGLVTCTPLDYSTTFSNISG